jgi:hypothetical protein
LPSFFLWVWDWHLDACLPFSVGLVRLSPFNVVFSVEKYLEKGMNV